MDLEKKLERARRVAKAMATTTILCVLIIIYGVVKKMESDKQVTRLSLELELCRTQK
jgi:hypothetical protein